MKDKLLLLFLAAAVLLSVFFAYERSFVSQDFELINSEEEEGGELDMESESEDSEAAPNESEME